MQLHATVLCDRHYEEEKMMFPLKCGVPDLQDRPKSCVWFIKILVNLDVVLRFLTFLFCIEIWIPQVPPISKASFELNEKLVGAFRAP